MTDLLDHDRLLGVREDRQSVAMHECEVRAVGANELVAVGYASLFEDPYPVAGGPKAGGWTEIVERSAFNRTLGNSPDVVFVLDHARTGYPLARTTADDLKLSADSKGLHVEARIDRRHPEAPSIEFALEKRHMQEMSLAFRTVHQAWSADGKERRLLELNLDKGDVSLVRHGANSRTRMGLAAATIEALSELTSMELRDFDDPRASLTEARAHLERLLTELSPPTPTRLTLTEARRIEAGLA